MTIRSTRCAVSLAIACAWLACASPARAAAAAAPASAPAAQSAASASAPVQVTVKAGQSLADIAAAATGSHDKTVLGRASRSIFDANPSAFMRGDPSLLKLGAVLNVPALDATGAVAKTESASAAAATSPPSTPPAGSAASQAAASGAQAAKPASAAPNVAPAAPASAPAASAVAPAANVGAHPASAPAPAPAHAQPSVPSGASGGHAWSGAIEPAPTVPASAAAQAPASAVAASGGVAASAVAPASSPAVAGACAPPASGAMPAAPASAPAPVASGPAVASAAAASHPKVSSLQQLLALKNRVLMELQRHGIGASTAPHPAAQNGAPVGASGFAAPPASGPVSARAPGQSRAVAAANQRFIGIGNYGVTLARNQIPVVAAIVAAIVAALLVLLIALGVSRRRHASAAARPAGGSGAGATSAARGAQAERVAAVPSAAPDDPIAAEFLAILARTPSSKRALMGLAAHYAERKNVQGFDEIAQRIYRLSGGRGPNWTHVAAIGRQLDPENPLFALEAGAADETVLSPDDEDAVPGVAVADEHAALPPSEGAAPPAHPGEHTPPPMSEVGESEPVDAPEPEPDRPQAVAEPAPDHRGVPAEAPHTPVEPPVEPTLPPEAIAALDGLDIGLPPRVGPAAETPAESGEGHPAEPEEELPAAPASAEQPSHDHDEEPEQADEKAAAATHTPTAPPAVTGLGAAPVGKLNLSFDLNLPGGDAATGEAAQSEVEPQPQFTPEQLAKIARNKLDLAAEYIALGDLGGARTLIHEVIESNDAATHDEAHAMLATLAPLS